MPTLKDKNNKGARVSTDSTERRGSDTFIGEKRDTTSVSPIHRLDILKQVTSSQPKKK